MTFSENYDRIIIEKEIKDKKSQNFFKKIKKDLTNKIKSDIIKISKGERKLPKINKNRVATNAMARSAERKLK